MSTIVAISTALGVGGIGIIRISGERSFEIINKIFIPKRKNSIESYKLKYGKIIDKKKNEADEVLVSYFKAPNSYTGEDVCEINSHGGVVIVKKILKICLENGAELAEPGEFTKRAFLNGRIDLTQAEAVIDIINSKTEKESEASIRQLEGSLSLQINKIEKLIVDLLVIIETNIDYPEYDIEQVTSKKINEVLYSVKGKLENLEKGFENGKIIREGINVAIIGKPNVGKSSLLNALLREDRAIVTEFEGTTRDTIEEFIEIEGKLFKIIDTAGIRNTSNQVEKIGIEKAKKMAEKSDLVIAMFDVANKMDEEDKKILSIIDKKEKIVVFNKMDNEKIDESFIEVQNKYKDFVKMSLKEKRGIEELYKKMLKFTANSEIDNQAIITNERHNVLVGKAKKNIEEAIKTFDSNMPIDVISINIKEALGDLGEITGKNVSEEVLNTIFSKFCLGK